MISLARHIELLLLEHDCVIVPSLGGFIANHAEARYSGGEDSLFLPPFRTIGFNQQLQVNDGLLVQSYMVAYDASYPSAQLQMEKDIEKMMIELELKGEYTLEHIGTFKKGLNQNITFIAQETGLLTPSLYGLSSFEMQSLRKVIKAREIEMALKTATTPIPLTPLADNDKKQNKTKKRSKDIIIRINRHWLDFSISAAAAILLFFCISYPTLRTISNETDTVMAAFYPINSMVNQSPVTMTEEPSVQKTEPLVVEKEQAQPIAEKASETEPTKTIEKKVEAPRFAIVLASYVSEHNANIFIEHLAKAGFKEGRYVKTGKVSRILYSGYPNETEAQSALQALRKECADFSDGWILEL